MNFDRMRVLLLERAIRGELVPQLTEDGSGIEQVGDRKGLFDIPKSWRWFEFSNVVKTISSRGYQIPAKEISEKGHFPVVTQSKNILIDGYSEEESKLVPKAFLPLLVFGDHTRFLKYIDFQFIVGADGTKLIRPKDDNLVNCSYLYYVLRALVPETKDRGYSRHFQFLKKLMIPVPPIHEQCRIVDRVEELLSEIDRAEKAYDELQTLAGVLRGQILQEAVQGKLIPQLDSEEEVQQIGDAPKEVPFAIPEKWKWVTLSELVPKIVDCPHSTPKYSSEETKFLAIDTNCITPVGVIKSWRYVTEEIYKKRVCRLEPQKDDIIYTREGSIGRAARIPDGARVCMGQRVMLIRPGTHLEPSYLQWYLMSHCALSHLTAKQRGIGVKHINVADVKKLPIPVPPVLEQRRIVAKIEELFQEVEKISR